MVVVHIFSRRNNQLFVNMLASADFQLQLASIMDILAKAAVAEICKLFEDGSAAWKMEIYKHQKENEALRTKLQLMENQLWTSRQCDQHQERLQESFQSTATQESLPEIKTESTEADVSAVDLQGSVQSRPLHNTEDLITIESQHTFEDWKPHPTSVHHHVPDQRTMEAALKGDPERRPSFQSPEQGVPEHQGVGASKRTDCGHQVCTGDSQDEYEGPRAPCFTEDCAVIEMENLPFDSAHEKYGPTDWTPTGDPISDTPETHKKTALNEKRFICMLCGKCFPYVSHLKRHLRIHTGEKPYSCVQCGKRFSDGSNKKKHERIHKGKRPFHCPQCGKRFTSRCHLKRHQKTHAGEV
ncbi:gastrula zinc finger protein xFG20-1-like [Brienomyrus brachyistius]|uniref:gastrula zinc finger protein xFG20-1-like n=1 Tax=Brienomyrus brachyistius TaxID=42636 RepID=UPI0020B185C9|nr:gastrula zinc finger protein xFG20-1-like [Brienomyrus brachyistius]